MHTIRLLRAPFLCLFLVLLILGASSVLAAPPKKLDRPPLGERWFGIYVDNDRVGFNRLKVAEASEGYRIENDGTVRMKVMGFSKDASSRETYVVGKNLALKSFEVEQTINGTLSRLKGRVSDTSLFITVENGGGKPVQKVIRLKGDLFPGPVLNIYPLMRDPSPGKSYKIPTFDPEEVKVKDVNISVIGEGKAPEGSSGIKLRNNLYPFVHNDIWTDRSGNTLFESVRDGLVVTKAEEPKDLGAYVGSLAMARKDLIYDFSLVRATPPIADQQKLKGLVLEISGWNDSLPLLQGGGQSVEKIADGTVRVRTGIAMADAGETTSATAEKYLAAAERIESDAEEIRAKAREIAGERKNREEIATELAKWTAAWLKDSIDDGGGALESLKSRFGNCQTHSRLYTALARAAGIPTRFVSGLVSLEGKGFLYHSWAESLIGERWVPVDPTYAQLPADPTHIKFFEGHTQEDLAPIIALIGRIRIAVLETRY